MTETEKIRIASLWGIISGAIITTIDNKPIQNAHEQLNEWITEQLDIQE